MGNISEIEDFSFRILSPWYANHWAYLTYFLFLLLIMASIWLIILKRYKNALLSKVRLKEELRLKRLNQNLRIEIEEKNKELFSQTSFIIQKNELMLKVKNEIDDFYHNYSENKTFKPLYTKINTLLNKNMDVEEDWKMFMIQFEQKHTGFFKRLKTLYPQLTPSDLRLCACLRLNMESKDIASLMNVSLRSIENSRYRIRKKLKIPQNKNLIVFFMEI